MTSDKKYKLVGMEGSSPSDGAFNCGAAILQDKEFLINSVSGLRLQQPQDGWTQIKHQDLPFIEINPTYVLCINKRHSLSEFFEPQNISPIKEPFLHWYIFSKSKFFLFNKKIIEKNLSFLEKNLNKKHNKLLRKVGMYCLAIESKNIKINALMVACSPKDLHDRTKRIALAMIDDGSIEEFYSHLSKYKNALFHKSHELCN